MGPVSTSRTILHLTLKWYRPAWPLLSSERSQPCRSCGGCAGVPISLHPAWLKQPGKWEPRTFLCTSLRIRNSAERSRQAFRLGGTLLELKMSGEKLGSATGENTQKARAISTTESLYGTAFQFDYEQIFRCPQLPKRGTPRKHGRGTGRTKSTLTMGLKCLNPGCQASQRRDAGIVC